jgi:Alginate export
LANNHGDFHLAPSLRIFAELQSGLEFGRIGGPRPAIDEDKLDVSQLFLELKSSTQQNKIPIEVRVGRQNLNYGDGSVVSIRDRRRLQVRHRNPAGFAIKAWRITGSSAGSRSAAFNKKLGAPE